jgi:protein tyrosine phosphatase
VSCLPSTAMHACTNLPPADNINRVCMRILGGTKGSDYINASFVDVSDGVTRVIRPS